MRDKHIIALGVVFAALVTGVILYSVGAYNAAVTRGVSPFVRSAQP